MRSFDVAVTVCKVLLSYIVSTSFGLLFDLICSSGHLFKNNDDGTVKISVIESNTSYFTLFPF